MAREKGRQHDLEVAKYKRETYLANNTVAEELVGKISHMQEEHENELRSMGEQTNLFMHDVTRNSASMDAKYQEEKRNMQEQFAQILCFLQRKTGRYRKDPGKVVYQRQQDLCTSRNSRNAREEDERKSGHTAGFSNSRAPGTSCSRNRLSFLL